MPNSFFALVFRQKYIRRWGLMRNVTPENLSEHSSETAILAHALATVGNNLFGKNYDVGFVASVALLHDTPEVFTGDLPTPVKYFDRSLRESYGNIERNAAEKLLGKLPPELRQSYGSLMLCTDDGVLKLVKAADRLSAYIKCIEEEKSGNTEFVSAKQTIYEKLASSDLPELDYFMKNLLPAFTLTLDQM